MTAAHRAYASMELETGVTGASPARLIVMLYEGALKSIFVAKAAMAQNDTPTKGSAISRAIAIIDEGLSPALDLKAGGEIASNLKLLYQYICSRLLYANLKNNVSSLDEAARLLTDLKSAWEALEQRDRPTAPAVPVPEPQTRRAPVSFGKA
ncbi:MAG: flagellar export chaperone FliS [Betaproteobacteria bacterium]